MIEYESDMPRPDNYTELDMFYEFEISMCHIVRIKAENIELAVEKLEAMSGREILNNDTCGSHNIYGIEFACQAWYSKDTGEFMGEEPLLVTPRSCNAEEWIDDPDVPQAINEYNHYQHYDEDDE